MGGSRVVAGAAASCGVLNIQNQESAENDRVAPLMICVRSSFTKLEPRNHFHKF